MSETANCDVNWRKHRLLIGESLNYSVITGTRVTQGPIYQRNHFLLLQFWLNYTVLSCIIIIQCNLYILLIIISNRLGGYLTPGPMLKRIPLKDCNLSSFFFLHELCLISESCLLFSIDINYFFKSHHLLQSCQNWIAVKNKKSDSEIRKWKETNIRWTWKYCQGQNTWGVIKIPEILRLINGSSLSDNIQRSVFYSINWICTTLRGKKKKSFFQLKLFCFLSFFTLLRQKNKNKTNFCFFTKCSGSTLLHCFDLQREMFHKLPV